MDRSRCYLRKEGNLNGTLNARKPIKSATASVETNPKKVTKYLNLEKVQVSVHLTTNIANVCWFDLKSNKTSLAVFR
jgi:hypothetical protein